MLGIYAALTGKSREQVLAGYAGKGFSEFKKDLADLAVSVLGPIGDEMRRLTADAGYVDGVLHRGAERAGTIASQHMAEVKDIMGLLRT